MYTAFSSCVSISYFWSFPCPSRVAGGALLPSSPLRTVLARLRAHGSSTSRTILLLLLFLPELSSLPPFFCRQLLVVVLLAVAECSICRGMNLLMIEGMNQCQVAVGVFSSL